MPSAPRSNSLPGDVAAALGDGDRVGLHVGHRLPDVCVVPVRHPRSIPRSASEPPTPADPPARRDARSETCSLRCARGPRPPRRRRSPPAPGPGVAGRAPAPDRPPARRGRLRGAPLGPAVRARCRPADPAHDRRGASAGRRAAPGQPDRHRMGRANPPVRRHRGTEGPLALAAAQRRGVLVPALLRAGRRLRPGLADHPGRARRRPLRGQRAEGVDQLRPHRQVGHPARPHRPGGDQAHGHQLLRLPHGCARASRSARSST